MTCTNDKVAYKISLKNISGAEILKNVGDRHLEDYFVEGYQNTHFDLLESEVSEEHYRYGIQTKNFNASGTYKGKPFTLQIEYKKDFENVIGDFSEDEKRDITNLGYGGNMYDIMEALDKIYRSQNPNTPKLNFCTH